MNRIKELRTEAGMLQKELATKLNVGVSTICYYERSEREFDTATTSRLCDIFDCSADYLLCRSDMRKPDVTEDQYAMLVAYSSLPESSRKAVDALLEPYIERH